MRITKVVVAALATLSSVAINAQPTSVSSTIPGDALFVLSVNGGRLQSKIDMKEFQNNESVLDIQEKIYESVFDKPITDSTYSPLVGKLDQLGINTNVSSFLYFKTTELYVSATYAFELKNFDAYQLFIEKLVPEKSRSSLELENDITGFETGNGTTFFTWKGDIAQIKYIMKKSNVDRFSRYSYNFYQTDINYDSINLIQDKKRRIDVIKDINNSYNKNSATNLVNGKSFGKFLELEGDLTVWSDYEELIKMYYSSLPMHYMFDQFSKLYMDTYMTGSLNFHKTGVDIKMNQFLGDKMFKYTKQMQNSKFKKQMLKYVPEDFVACIGLTFNPDPIIPMIKDVMYPIIQNESEYGQSITDMMDVIDVFLDEKSVYEMVEGDGIFIYNGLKEQEYTRTFNKYDEDYNYEEVTETKVEMIPTFSFMFSTENEEIWDKIFRMRALGGKYSYKGGYYSFKSYSGEVSYCAVYKGVCFISNDDELITKFLKTGLPKNQLLLNDTKKVFKSSTSFILAKSLDKALPDDVGRFASDYKKFLNKYNVTSADVKSGKLSKNSVESTASIQFGDGDKNVLASFVEMVDQIITENSISNYARAYPEEATEYYGEEGTEEEYNEEPEYIYDESEATEGVDGEEGIYIEEEEAEDAEELIEEGAE